MVLLGRRLSGGSRLHLQRGDHHGDLVLTGTTDDDLLVLRVVLPRDLEEADESRKNVVLEG